MHILIADTKRPPKIILGEWPRYTEAALCRVYGVAALYGGRVMPRIRSGRVIRRPRYAAYTEWPRYTEAALCRVNAVAALYGVAALYRVGPHVLGSRPLLPLPDENWVRFVYVRGGRLLLAAVALPF